MSESRYPIPAGVHRVQETIQRSRFITTVSHAPAPTPAHEFIKQIRDEFPDATHNCWAFASGPSGSTSHVRFSDDGGTVSFMAENGTHLHVKLEMVKELRFLYTETNERGLPSYSVWFQDENLDSVLRIYLRKSEIEATNQPRQDLFMELLEKYGETLQLTG